MCGIESVEEAHLAVRLGAAARPLTFEASVAASARAEASSS